MLETRIVDKACLELCKSFDVLVLVSILWYEHLVKGGKTLGFKESSYDKHVRSTLQQPNIFIVVFVHDCGISSSANNITNEFIKALREKGFELHKEGSFTEFLGAVPLDPQQDGSMHMYQSGLITKILQATDI
jgi:hypothetical protein